MKINTACSRAQLTLCSLCKQHMYGITGQTFGEFQIANLQTKTLSLVDLSDSLAKTAASGVSIGVLAITGVCSLSNILLTITVCGCCRISNFLVVGQ